MQMIPNGETTTNYPENELNSGSLWHRWEPHVHAPGTVLNDQFTGDDPWGDYFDALEASEPRIKAIAVTDYYLTDTYKHVVQEKANGRLPDVELIFPNVELRLDVGTMKGRWVNVHFLVNPEDSEHLVQLHRFLAPTVQRALDLLVSGLTNAMMVALIEEVGCGPEFDRLPSSDRTTPKLRNLLSRVCREIAAASDGHGRFSRR